jgi:hypothetical protein
MDPTSEGWDEPTALTLAPLEASASDAQKGGRPSPKKKKQAPPPPAKGVPRTKPVTVTVASGWLGNRSSGRSSHAMEFFRWIFVLVFECVVEVVLCCG